MEKNIFIFLLATFIVFGFVFGAEDKPVPIRTLIVTGETDLPYHFWRETTTAIKSILNQSGRFEVRVVEEPGGINESALEGYDVVLLNYNGPRWAVEAESALEKFVKNGGGLVSFHQSSYGTFFGHVMGENGWQKGPPDSGWKEFPKIIGAWWAPEDIGHARRTVFQVDWLDTEHPVAKNLPKSFMANDELYHKLNLSSDVKVLADGLSPADLGGTGKREPLVWTNNYGRGRVFYTVLGHDTLAFHEPGMANIFSRGTEWAATGNVTLPPVTRKHGAAEAGEVRLLVVTEGHTYPMEFYAMLESLPNVSWYHAGSHKEAFSNPVLDRYDVILLHDMIEESSENTRLKLKEFVENGGGIISLHHAIVDFTDWPWWYEEVTGGKYFTQPKGNFPASQYKEGIEFLVRPVKGKEGHPVLRGVGPLWVDDELYKGMYHSKGIEVLMETSHPDNDPPIAYIGPFEKARVIYIQLGHSGDTMENPGFRRLMSNAIQWVSRKSTGSTNNESQ